MFIDLDLAGVSLILCGPPRRTHRVALKYGRAASLTHCSEPTGLARLSGQPASLLVFCLPEGRDEDAWLAAARKAFPEAARTFDREEPAGETGTVYLIGAGPGRADYMTARAFEVLATCDVVLIDHLSPTQKVQDWAPGAEIIDVGKVPGKHKVPQRDIDRMMIDYALAGKNVARMKGGDPYVFGRGTEELYVCEQAGLTVEVVSGVTSSIAVPASAKVPMTLRKVSHMFTVVSGHAELSEVELDHLAGLVQSGGTISLLMGVRTLPHTVAGLLERGVAEDTPVGTFEDVYRSHERVRFSTLGSVVDDVQDVRPPAITVIGRVVAAGDETTPEAVARRDDMLRLALSEGRDQKA